MAARSLLILKNKLKKINCNQDFPDAEKPVSDLLTGFLAMPEHYYSFTIFCAASSPAESIFTE